MHSYDELCVNVILMFITKNWRFIPLSWCILGIQLRNAHAIIDFLLETFKVVSDVFAVLNSQRFRHATTIQLIQGE